MWRTIPAKQQEQELRFKPILIGIRLMSVAREKEHRGTHRDGYFSRHDLNDYFNDYIRFYLCY